MLPVVTAEETTIAGRRPPRRPVTFQGLKVGRHDLTAGVTRGLVIRERALPGYGSLRDAEFEVRTWVVTGLM
jgi:hypothetical protein